jgi:hypothetical protein
MCNLHKRSSSSGPTGSKTRVIVRSSESFIHEASQELAGGPFSRQRSIDARAPPPDTWGISVILHPSEKYWHSTMFSIEHVCTIISCIHEGTKLENDDTPQIESLCMAVPEGTKWLTALPAVFSSPIGRNYLS